MKLMIDDTHMEMEGKGIDLIAALTVLIRNVSEETKLQPSLILTLIGQTLNEYDDWVD